MWTFVSNESNQITILTGEGSLEDGFYKSERTNIPIFTTYE